MVVVVLRRASSAVRMCSAACDGSLHQPAKQVSWEQSSVGGGVGAHHSVVVVLMSLRTSTAARPSFVPAMQVWKNLQGLQVSWERVEGRTLTFPGTVLGAGAAHHGVMVVVLRRASTAVPELAAARARHRRLCAAGKAAVAAAAVAQVPSRVAAARGRPRLEGRTMEWTTLIQVDDDNTCKPRPAV